MKHINVRSATGDDVARIAGLFYADMVDLGERPEERRLRAVAEEAVQSNGAGSLLRVAEDSDGTIVGVLFGLVRPSLKTGSDSVWVEELYVVPGARRSGIGSILVEDLIDWCSEHGVESIELEAYRMNTAASILYRSHGFRRLPRERYSVRLKDLEEYE